MEFIEFTSRLAYVSRVKKKTDAKFFNKVRQNDALRLTLLAKNVSSRKGQRCQIVSVENIRTLTCISVTINKLLDIFTKNLDISFISNE